MHQQNLKIKSVLGHTTNVVASQIFVALCINLLIGFQKFVSRTLYGTQAVFRSIQLNAFVREPFVDLLCRRKQEPLDPQMAFMVTDA